MKLKEKRPYRAKGLDFSNLNFSSAAEKKFIRVQIEAIALQIKELRKEHGFSQEELAEKLSVSLSTVKAIENNQRAPSLPMLLKIIYLLDMKIKLN